MTKKLLIDTYMEHTPDEIRAELAKFSSDNFGNGPALPANICEYLHSIGITEGFLQIKN